MLYQIYDPKTKTLKADIFVLLLTVLVLCWYIFSKTKNRSKNKNHLIVDENNCVKELSESQWKEFYEKGYVKIGKTLSNEELKKLKQRIKDLMLGKIQYGNKLLMQLDVNSEIKDDYFKNDLATKGQTTGFKGPTLNYRKIGEAGCGLECDDLFLSFMKKPIFKSICKRIYGNHTPISIYRAMVFNKPSTTEEDNKNGGGTHLPWHQDGGNWWALDRDPLIFVWTALYPSTIESGCVKVVKKSYELGILSRTGHMLEEKDVKKYCSNEDNIEYLIAQPGETFLVHNWTIHCSETNKTSLPRWAFSANFIDGRTRVLNPKPEDAGTIGTPGQSFPVVFEAF